MSQALEVLGYAPGTRVAIVHQDDVGMNHGANEAFLQLSQGGLVTCGSVMVPCPWFLETAALAREYPELDLGVHLTLTAEWQTYRWGPVSTRDPVSGLLDEQGYFWHRAPAVRERLNVNAAVGEFRRQIDMAYAEGIDVTHLDTHMAAAMMPELVDAYAQLGLEYRVPVLIYADPTWYQEALGVTSFGAQDLSPLAGRLAAAGMPIPDHFQISPNVIDHPQDDATYREMFTTLQPGLTFFSLHPNAPGELSAMTPTKAGFRYRERAVLNDPAFAAFVAAEGIELTGYRPLRDAMRRRQAEMREQ